MANRKGGVLKSSLCRNVAAVAAGSGYRVLVVDGDPQGNTKAGFTAETEINRKDWGLEWNVALEAGGVLVGEKVKIQLEIEAVKG